MILESKIPDGPIAEKWDNHRFSSKLVNPANKRKYRIIVVGSGLAGGAAAATLGELGYNVDCFCYQDTPRRLLIQLPPKVASTQPRITKTTETAFIGFFTIQSKVEISVLAKQTSIASHKSA